MSAQAHAPGAARPALPEEPAAAGAVDGPAGSRRRRLAYLALFAAGAAISGYTLLRGIDPFDEGLVLQAARRIAAGQTPYSDFIWPYGPGQPYLLAGTFKLSGTSLLGWRILRTATDAAIALVVYALVRREAPPKLALVAWATAACGIAEPTTANPFPLPLLFGLLAFAAATGRWDSRNRALAAGALTALAAAWRLDFGLYASVAVAIALALGPGEASVRRRTLAIYGATAAGVAVLVYLPFAIAAGPADLYDRLVGTALREGGYWTLPFPLGYGGGLSTSSVRALVEHVKDALVFYVPLLLAIGLVLAALATALRWRSTRSAPATWLGLLALGAGMAVYMLSRTDEFHAGPLLVVLAVLLPLAFVWLRGRPSGQALRLGVGAVLALLLAAGAANRLAVLLFPHRFDTLHVAVADGVEAQPADARALPRVVQLVQRLVPRGEPIYVVTRRSDLVRLSDPLLYVLTERDNPTPRDVGLYSSTAAQRQIVAQLRAARPRAIVRWTDPISARREPNRRGLPGSSRALDAYLAARYRPLARFGFYEVLVPRGGAGGGA